MSNEFLEIVAGEGVELDPCATQAHWQNGVTERAIMTIFSAAATLEADHEFEKEEAVDRSVAAHNSVERVEGDSPTQWAFGRAPSWQGLMFDDEAADVNAARWSNEKFKEGLERQATAQHVISLKILRAQEVQARNARNRRRHVFAPGMRVCVWRTGRPSKRDERGPGIGPKKGRWYSTDRAPCSAYRQSWRTEFQNPPRKSGWSLERNSGVAHRSS